MVSLRLCCWTIAPVLQLVAAVGLPAQAALVGHWQLDETAAGPVVNDIGLVDGTNNGATNNQPGRVGSAYSFDGTNDKVNTNLNSVVPATGPMSIFG